MIFDKKMVITGQTRFLMLIPAAFICLVFFFGSFTASVFAWGGLKSKIQDELDSNPFLKNGGIKLRVVSEENGYVTVEMYEGQRKIRESINKGWDINSENETILLGKFEGCYKDKIIVLRKSINYIQKMEGVKEVLLTAALNTATDKFEDDFYKAKEQSDKQQYAKAMEILRPGAEAGYAPSQSRLGSI